MSLVPDFEIGIWNAWILTIWLVIQNFGIKLVSKELYRRAGGSSDMKPGRAYRIISLLSMPLWFLAIIYSIFLPLKLGTVWFAAGLIIFLLGLVVNITATINFATTPFNKPVTGGAYRYSRHPIYVALFLIYMGVSIASASWIFLLFTIIWAGMAAFSIRDEEYYCLEKYGEEYRNYKNRTPRWIGKFWRNR